VRMKSAYAVIAPVAIPHTPGVGKPVSRVSSALRRRLWKRVTPTQWWPGIEVPGHPIQPTFYATPSVTGVVGMPLVGRSRTNLPGRQSGHLPALLKDSSAMQSSRNELTYSVRNVMV